VEKSKKKMMMQERLLLHHIVSVIGISFKITSDQVNRIRSEDVLSFREAAIRRCADRGIPPDSRHSIPIVLVYSLGQALRSLIYEDADLHWVGLFLTIPRYLQHTAPSLAEGPV
jgi:hypothetical protein